jgi:hypothetical protein
MWAEGQKSYPQHHVLKTFSWKVTDGDSAEPNKNLRKPCDNEGWPGHWVVAFGGAQSPNVFARDERGRCVGMLPESVSLLKLGGFYQVSGSVSGNGRQDSPGVYANYSMVLFTGHGPEIVVGPDADTVFGVGAPSAAVVAPPVVPAAAAAPMLPVVPNPSILRPPVTPAQQLTDKAQGASYQELLANGWTDALLVQHGLMVA